MRGWRVGIGIVLAAVWLPIMACGRSERFETMATGTSGQTQVTVSAHGGGMVKGDNIIRVEFRGADSQPLDVTGPGITLNAPASGALGAVSHDVSLAHRGPGLYEGRVYVTRSGPWTGQLKWQEADTPRQWTFIVPER